MRQPWLQGSHCSNGGYRSGHPSCRNIHEVQTNINYRTSSKNKAATTAIIIMHTAQSLIGWCLKKLNQSYSMNAITVECDVSFATKPDSSTICTNVHVKANPNDIVSHCNAVSTNICINSCDNVKINSKTKCVNM